MAVRALLHYALEVPDPSVGEKFYRSFGLVDEPARGDLVRLRPARVPPAAVLLYPGPKKRLHHLALGALDGGLWIRDPDGNAINIRPEPAATPPPDPPRRINSPGHIARVAARGYPDAGAAAAPRRLGHVLLFHPDVDRQLIGFPFSSAATTARRSRALPPARRRRALTQSRPPISFRCIFLSHSTCRWPLCLCECHAKKPAGSRPPAPRGGTCRAARGRPDAGRDGRRR